MVVSFKLMVAAAVDLDDGIILLIAIVGASSPIDEDYHDGGARWDES